MINSNLFNENDYEAAMNKETFFKLTKEAAYQLYVSLFNKYQETKKQNEVLKEMMKRNDDDKQTHQIEEFYEERQSSSSSSDNGLGFKFGYQRSSLVKDVHVLLSGLTKQNKTKLLDKKQEFKEHFKGFIPTTTNEKDKQEDKQKEQIQEIIKDKFYENKVIVEHQILKQKEMHYNIGEEQLKFNFKDLEPSEKEKQELKLLTKKMLRENKDDDEIIQMISDKAKEQTENKMPLVEQIDDTNKQMMKIHKDKVVQTQMKEITKVISQNKNIFKIIYDFCIDEQKRRESSNKYDVQTTNMRIKLKTITDHLKKNKCDVKASKEMMKRSISINITKEFAMIDLKKLNEEKEQFKIADDDDDDGDDDDDDSLNK